MLVSVGREGLAPCVSVCVLNSGSPLDEEGEGKRLCPLGFQEADWRVLLGGLRDYGILLWGARRALLSQLGLLSFREQQGPVYPLLPPTGWEPVPLAGPMLGLPASESRLCVCPTPILSHLYPSALVPRPALAESPPVPSGAYWYPECPGAV